MIESDVLIDTSEGIIVEVGQGLDVPEDCKVITTIKYSQIY